MYYMDDQIHRKKVLEKYMISSQNSKVPNLDVIIKISFWLRLRRDNYTFESAVLSII